MALSKVLASWDRSLSFPDVHSEATVLLGQSNEMKISSISGKSGKDLGATPAASNHQREFEMLTAASFTVNSDPQGYSP